ncbi:hypothetical protein [Derxia lacustris]|uniref:hypothetical protein n=1 Tax=Derxia lacustris TaxID=764842 RepID=UPI00111C19FB|nr:hypothetical protein [Derxia lacustris]
MSLAHSRTVLLARRLGRWQSFDDRDWRELLARVAQRWSPELPAHGASVALLGPLEPRLLAALTVARLSDARLDDRAAPIDIVFASGIDEAGAALLLPLAAGARVVVANAVGSAAWGDARVQAFDDWLDAAPAPGARPSAAAPANAARFANPTDARRADLPPLGADQLLLATPGLAAGSARALAAHWEDGGHRLALAEPDGDLARDLADLAPDVLVGARGELDRLADALDARLPTPASLPGRLLDDLGSRAGRALRARTRRLLGLHRLQAIWGPEGLGATTLALARRLDIAALDLSAGVPTRQVSA